MLVNSLQNGHVLCSLTNDERTPVRRDSAERMAQLKNRRSAPRVGSGPPDASSCRAGALRRGEVNRNVVELMLAAEVPKCRLRVVARNRARWLVPTPSRRF